jgi:hypothetical protein
VSKQDEVTAFLMKAAKQRALNTLRNQPRGLPPGWNRDSWLEMLRLLHDGAIRAGATPEEIKATGFTLNPF